MLKKVYGIDFGTSYVKIYKKGKGIILSERNVVSTIGKNKEPVAIGEKAYDMFEKQPPSINVSFPLSHGVVSRLGDMVALWNYMNNHIIEKRKHSDYYIAVPADITEVEKQAYSQIIYESEIKPKKVYLIDMPIANAYGLGIDLKNTRGAFIVDIGADTTEITILSLGGIVVSRLLPYGGNYFDERIKEYVKKTYNFAIGRKTAEMAKKSLLNVYNLESTVELTGRDVMRGLPGELTVRATEIFPLVRDVFEEIAVNVRSMLEHTPPEISTEIEKKGLYLVGGSALIPGVDDLLKKATGLEIIKRAEPEKNVVEGLGYLTENPSIAAKHLLELR